MKNIVKIVGLVTLLHNGLSANNLIGMWEKHTTLGLTPNEKIKVIANEKVGAISFGNHCKIYVPNGISENKKILVSDKLSRCTLKKNLIIEIGANSNKGLPIKTEWRESFRNYSIDIVAQKVEVSKEPSKVPENNMDIVAVKLGMSNDDIKKSLNYSYNKEDGGRDSLSSTIGYYSKFNRPVPGVLDFVVVSYGKKSTANIISRCWNPKEPPTVKGTLEALTEKYGKPSTAEIDKGRGSNGEYLIWLYDKSGKQLFGEEAKKCKRAKYRDPNRVSMSGKWKTYEAPTQARYHDQCGYTLEVKVFPDRRDFVDLMTTILYDQSTLLYNIWDQELTEATYKINKEKSLQQAAKSVKPKI